MPDLSIPDLSVIIPTLNEAEALPALLHQLGGQQHIKLQIIVADGGSSDATRQLAHAAGATVLRTQQPGRGRQLNAGARMARASWLLFLHADSTLTSNTQLSEALSELQEAIQRSGNAKTAGHFTLEFAHDANPEKFSYRYIAAKTHLNRVNTTNGDQGFLLSRDFFQQVGPFDESMGFLEDQRLAEIIRREGQWLTLSSTIITSARRFESEGFARRYTIMAVIMAAHMTDMHEFFAMAPPLYAAQSDTGKLLVSRYADVIFPMMRRAPPRRRWRQILAYGQYVKNNFWQLFFMLDVHHHAAGELVKPKWLSVHDRRVVPLVKWRGFDLAVGLSIIVWFAVVLGTFYRIRDRRELAKLDETAPAKPQIKRK